MKILITGANGLLGHKLVFLLGQNPELEVLAASRGKSRLPEHSNCRYLELDLLDFQKVNSVLSEERPEVVIHTAAMTNVDLCETEKEMCTAINVDAVDNLIDICNAVNAHLIHLSTDFIFNGDQGPLEEEGTQPDPVNFYGQSKLESEKLIVERSNSYGIARTVLVYGVTPGLSRSNIILWVRDSLMKRQEINVVTDQFRTPTLAEDLAMGCSLMALKKAQGIFHISGKDFLTPYEMAIQTAEYFKLDKSLIHKTDSTKFRQTAKRPLKTGFVIEKARNMLGYEPHSFQEGIEIVAKSLNLS